MIHGFIALIAAFLMLTAPNESPGRHFQNANGPAAQSAAGPVVVVKVSGESITEKQVLDTINQLALQHASSGQTTDEQMLHKDTVYFKDAVDTLIGTILLKNEAKGNNLVADKAKIDETFQSMKKQFPDEAKFQQALLVQGVTEAELRASIETNILCQQVLDTLAKSVPAPADSEISKFYDENPKLLIEPQRVHAAILYLKVDKDATAEQKAEIRKKIEAIRADIDAGKITFADAARKESEDKVTGQKGGDLGFFKREDILKPLGDAAFSSAPGTLTPPIEAENGLYLMQVVEIKPEGKMTLEAATPRIKDFLLRKAVREATLKHLADLKTKTTIEYVISEEEWNKRHGGK